MKELVSANALRSHVPHPWPRHQAGLALRSMFPCLGYRFTVNGPKNKSLPGKPDLVLLKQRTVIFVHGVFKYTATPIFLPCHSTPPTRKSSNSVGWI
jgi:G:T-mismatch repair DNA endonuclease (very short patch repair protein)